MQMGFLCYRSHLTAPISYNCSTVIIWTVQEIYNGFPRQLDEEQPRENNDYFRFALGCNRILAESCTAIKHHKGICGIWRFFLFNNETFTVEFAPSTVTDRPLTKTDGTDKDKEASNPECCNADLLLTSETVPVEEIHDTVIEIRENNPYSPWAVISNYFQERGKKNL